MSARKSLVDVGVLLLERDGLAALTLRSIAREAGVSHGAPRHHFPTYAGLLAAIARRGVDDLALEVGPALALPDARESVARAVRAYVDFARRRPEMFELIARHDLLDGAGGELRGTTAPLFASLATRLGEIDPGADDARVLALWSGVHGLAVISSRRTAEAATGGAPDVDQVLDALIGGLLPGA